MPGISSRVFLAAMALGLLWGAHAQSEEKKRPNIVVLVSDDQRWDAMRCAGNPIIHTPNMDRLASQGTRFENAFSTTAICCASRASILTGMYTATHTIEDFATALPDDLFRQTYPGLLRQAGYYTGFAGKWGVGNDLPRGEFDFFEGFAGQGKYFNEIDGETVHMTTLIQNQALSFLQIAPEDRPYCLSVSFKAPHVQDSDPRQFLPDPAYDDLYRGTHIPSAATATDEFYRRQPGFVRNSEGRARWYKRFATPEEYETSVRRYYRLVSGIDHALGEILDAIDSRGDSDNTVIMFTSDHGFFLGERGLAGKWLMYEESIRIPLIVHDPRIAAADRAKTRKQMTLNIDLAPTILALAGIALPENMQGSSLLPLLRKGAGPWRSEWFYEHHFGIDRPVEIPASEGIRTDRWKYIRYVDRDPVIEELYDLDADPLEQRNLADAESHFETMTDLRNRWSAWKTTLKPWNDEGAAHWREPIRP